MERQLDESGKGLKELKDMQAAVNSIAASLIVKAPIDGSILTSYDQDDGEVWRKFRRGLIGRGFKSSFLQENESLIHAYLEELSNRGALDDPELTDHARENAHLGNEDIEMSSALPQAFVSDPQAGDQGSRKGHKRSIPKVRIKTAIRKEVSRNTLPDDNIHNVPIAHEKCRLRYARKGDPRPRYARKGDSSKARSCYSNPGSRQGHKSSIPSVRIKTVIRKEVSRNTLPDDNIHNVPIASAKSRPRRAQKDYSSRLENASRLHSMDRENSPLSIWSIQSELQNKHTWAPEWFVSEWTRRIYLRLLHYRRTHAVSLSPFFTEPPYPFYLKIETGESSDCVNGSSPAIIPLQLAMNASWAKHNFWLHSRGEALQDWQRWQRAHGPAVGRHYVETSQMFERFYLACPWGICLIYYGYNVSLLLADLEFVSRVVGHAKWQHLYCMTPEHRSIWVSLDSEPNSVTRFLSRSSQSFMDFLIWRLTQCLASEEDVSPWAADHSAEGEDPPTIEDVHGLACLSFVAKSCTIDSSKAEYEKSRAGMARIARDLEKYTKGDTLARLVDLCIDVDTAHILEKHSTTKPGRSK